MSEIQLKKKVHIKWSSNFAYAVGLIVSDGNLSSERKYIKLKSADRELVEKFRVALSIQNKIGITIPKSNPNRKHFRIEIGDTNFYNFLNLIGITAKKSGTIQAVEVPDKFFPDFLRGIFDGDGTFYYSWDRRWPNSLVFQISFASASLAFTKWLKNRLTALYGVKGFICKGDRVFNIRYVKRDTRKLFQIMYYKKGLLFLNRKYVKIINTLNLDANYKSR